MTTSHRSADYPLGNTDAEHERLIRQAARVAPITERFFREAGVGSGQRVLDIGSGVGDVAMLTARLVGPSGEVVAIERDPRSIVKARARVTEAGFHNVSFNESNVDEISDEKPFDAVVGRFILMYLPEPVAALRSISRLVRPEGVLVFQEPYWHNGITIPYAVCDRRWSSWICPSSRWVALTPWCTGCKPRLQNR